MLCSRHHLLKRGNVIFYTFYSPFWHTVDYFFPQYLLSIVSAQDEWLPIISLHEISVVFFLLFSSFYILCFGVIFCFQKFYTFYIRHISFFFSSPLIFLFKIFPFLSSLQYASPLFPSSLCQTILWLETVAPSFIDSLPSLFLHSHPSLLSTGSS